MKKLKGLLVIMLVLFTFFSGLPLNMLVGHAENVPAATNIENETIVNEKESNVLNQDVTEVGTIPIDIRIESWDHTIVPNQQIQVKPFDLTHVVGDNTVGNWYKNHNEPLAIHAIIQALQAKGIDVTKESGIYVKHDGNYIASIESLGEFDKGPMSGWMYRVNGEQVGLGVGEQVIKANDRVELYFVGNYMEYEFGSITASQSKIKAGEQITFNVTGFKTSWEGDSPSTPIEDVNITINGKESTYMTDRNGQVTVPFKEAGKYSISAEKRDEETYYNLIRPIPIEIEVEAVKVLETPKPEVPDLEKPNPEPVEAIEIKNPTMSEALINTHKYMQTDSPNPVFFKEWYILSLARGSNNVPQSYYDTYYKNVEEYVKNKQGILTKNNYTEYSRAILALTAIGKDPTNVGGYNLLEKLYNYGNVIKQGINGGIFALIALDSKKYEIPAESETVTVTRDKLVKFILEKQLADGGFALFGAKGDADITSMAIQALSSYKEKQNVEEAINKAVTFLSNIQQENGGYVSWGTPNVESAAQVLVALTSIGIDPKTDPRFIKGNGNWLLSNIMTFYDSKDGAFKHTLNGTSNSMATEQVSYALAAYDRFLNGKNKLYDMTDVVSKPETNLIEIPSITETINKNHEWILKNHKPVFGKEWNALSLARSSKGLDHQTYLDKYYQSVTETVVKNKGVLSGNYTEYSRTILALTALGKDPTNVGGYSLVEKLYDFEKVKRQGINGPIFALLALDATTGIKPTEHTTEYKQKLIDYIVGLAKNKGGFSLSPDKNAAADVDVTAMALQALSSYNEQPQVKAEIDKALDFLSTAQNAQGGYESWGTVNVESASQVLVALTSLGIDPRTDTRFIKGGNWILSNLFTFYIREDGAFKHTLDGKSNSMATEQASYALVAYDRFLNKKNKIYDMSDVKVETPQPEQPVKVPTVDKITVESTMITGNTEANAKVTALINKKEIGTTKAAEDGSFKITLSEKLEEGAQVSIVAELAGKKASETTSVVEATEAPLTLKIDEVTDGSTKVTGTTKSEVQVELSIGGKVTETVTASSDGKYSFSIAKQKAGVEIKVTVTDSKGKQQSKVVTVIDKTTPDLTISSVNANSISMGGYSKLNIEVRGVTEAGATVELFADKQLVQKVEADREGKYIVSGIGLTVYDDVTITASDTANNKVTKTVQWKDQLPLVLTVNEVTTTSTVITGSAGKGNKVEVLIDGKSVGTGTADAYGKYSIYISKQLAGAQITVIATDSTGKQESKTIKVVDKASPILSVNTVLDNNTSITGTTEGGARVELYIGGQFMQSTIASSSGSYYFKINPQKGGTLLTIIAIDAGGNKESRSVTVKEHKLPELSINEVKDNSTDVSGTTEARAKVELSIDNKMTQTVYADAYGKYSFTISKQKVGTTIAVSVINASGNKNTKKVTVSSATLPSLVINEMKEGSASVTGTTDAIAKVELFIDKKFTSLQKADKSGNFSFVVNKLKPGAIVTIKVTNEAGKTIEKTATVQGREVNPQPEPTELTLSLNAVGSNSSSITGLTLPGATVQLFINGDLRQTRTANARGDYAFGIAKLKTGVEVTVKAIDAFNNEVSKSTKVSQSNMSNNMIDKVGDSSSRITGKVEAGATVKLSINGKVRQTTKANANGIYVFGIGKQKVGVTITITTISNSGKVTSKTITVMDSTPPKQPTVKKVTIASTKLSGKAEAHSTVYAYSGATLLGMAVADSKGNYQIKMKKQKFGSTIVVGSKDKAENRSKGTSVKVYKR
ncbi:Ig-like domain-containing protein [Bacillus sp. JJ722]|uniref:Ig-like domain-containing protein n=1 Tax=Bacillus sp. JJ722 TaxID=3122973 RepID=UPI002FFDD76E